MLAMRTHSPGAPLRCDTVSAPEPGPGEVRLQVTACGINFADLLIIDDKYQEKPGYPLIPGLEVAGVVVEHGENVSTPAVGTRVAAMCGHGGFAEETCAQAVACVPVPDAMSDAEAAALQVAYGTADLALRHRANLTDGETLLVLGAAGGVGLTGVEIGKLLGARVIACARGSERLEAARAKGADVCIDTEQTDLREAVRAATDGRGCDVVYDPVGGEPFRAALRATAVGGRILPIGFASGEVPQVPANILLVKNLSLLGLYWGAYYRHWPEVLADSFRRILAWYEAGKIRPHVSRQLPLEEAETGINLLRSRRSTGKIVLLPGSSS